MNILSIQSSVAYGHVGNSAAAFPLQRLGHEVWPIYTVNYSNHTGYGQWRGPMIPASDVREVVRGIDDLGKLGEVDAVLSGYQGGVDIADAIIDTVARVKELNPRAIYSCDPVMGNAKSGCHVSDEIPPLLRDKVVPVADVITPNQFELGFLTGREATDLDSTIAAAHAARDMGPSTVLVTSVLRPEREDEDTIEMMVVADAGVWIVTTPHLPFKRNGSGDVTAALFTGHFAQSGDPADALAKTAASVFELLTVTFEADSRELELITAQDAFVAPTTTFEVRQVN